jgi:hypothetical protein
MQALEDITAAEANEASKQQEEREYEKKVRKRNP